MCGYVCLCRGTSTYLYTNLHIVVPVGWPKIVRVYGFLFSFREKHVCYCFFNRPTCKFFCVFFEIFGIVDIVKHARARTHDYSCYTY